MLVYVDKGLGASILRAGVRLWDHASPSPVATVKLTRHNLFHPTALVPRDRPSDGAPHRMDGRAGRRPRRRRRPALTRAGGGLAQLGQRDRRRRPRLRPSGMGAPARPRQRGRRRHAGVHRLLDGDPHPIPVAAGDVQRRVVSAAGTAPVPGTPGARPGGTGTRPSRRPATAAAWPAPASTRSRPIVDVCTRRPMAAFRGGRSDASTIPAGRALRRWPRSPPARRPSLLTSSYLPRVASLRVLAWLTLPAVDDAVDASRPAAARRPAHTLARRSGSRTPRPGRMTPGDDTVPTKTTPPSGPPARPARRRCSARADHGRSSAVSTRSWPARPAAAERRRPTATRPRAPPGGGPAPLRHRQRAPGPSRVRPAFAPAQRGDDNQIVFQPPLPEETDLVILRSTGPNGVTQRVTEFFEGDGTTSIDSRGVA